MADSPALTRTIDTRVPVWPTRPSPSAAIFAGALAGCLNLTRIVAGVAAYAAGAQQSARIATTRLSRRTESSMIGGRSPRSSARAAEVRFPQKKEGPCLAVSGRASVCSALPPDLRFGYRPRAAADPRDQLRRFAGRLHRLELRRYLGDQEARR